MVTRSVKKCKINIGYVTHFLIASTHVLVVYLPVIFLLIVPILTVPASRYLAPRMLSFMAICHRRERWTSPPTRAYTDNRPHGR